MKKIKVAMLGTYFHERGGVAMHTKKLAKYLSLRDDIELHVVTFGNEDKQIKKEGLYIHVIKKIMNIPDLVLIFQIRSLMREVGEINPDVVHAQGSVTPYSTAAAFLRNDYCTLLTIHGIAAIEIKFKKGVDFMFHRLVTIPNEKYVLSKISNIITVSPHAKGILEKMTDSNIYVISNGIDPIDIYNSPMNKKLVHPAILFFGVLRREKGIDLLLEAMTRIKEKIPNVHLYIAGSGSQENALKKLTTKLNIEEYVTFLGFVSEEEKPIIYKSADLYVLPSRYENEPITLLEAMSCGKAVVASRIYGIPYLVEDGETGLLFECGNVNELTEKIIILLKDKNLNAKMGKAGLERVKEFEWEKIADKTVEVYEKVYKEFNSI